VTIYEWDANEMRLNRIIASLQTDLDEAAEREKRLLATNADLSARLARMVDVALGRHVSGVGMTDRTLPQPRFEFRHAQDDFGRNPAPIHAAPDGERRLPRTSPEEDGA
jgi:hypothetical protein